MAKINWKQIERELPESGSNLYGQLSNTGSLEILGNGEYDNIFIITSGSTPSLRVNNQGVTIFGPYNQLPDPTPGGIAYSGSNFWVGIDE